MEDYIVHVEWAGYSRGTAKYLVKAESAEEAMENWYEGEEDSRQIVRDDTEKHVILAERRISDER